LQTIQQLMSLTGRSVLLTGAAGNLGKSIALTIAELGGDLILTDLPGSDYSVLSDLIKETSNVNVEIFDCQLENQKSRQKLLTYLNQRNKSLNVIINCAAFVGTSNLTGWATDFENQTIETWRRALEVNLTAVFDLCQGLTKILKEEGNSSIINISSIYGSNAPDYSLYEGTEMSNPAAYGVSKGGLIQLTRWLSSTIAPEIRVNSISFGGVFRNQDSEFVSRYIKRTPLNRMASEDDIMGIIAYLSSDMSSYVTGQDFIIDGGWSV
jgi:NAD(P)-dependent dehydrogenase (short-subunit alcohol dehydrogenase family)